MRRAVLSVFAVLLLGGCATARATTLADTAPPTPPLPTVMVADTDTQGRVLTDDKGDVLYHFDGDQGGAIGCTATCTATRHPLLHDPAGLLLPAGIAGTLGLVTRPDGGDQVTYDGEPLYTFTGDQPGDTSGVTLSWHVINPPDRPLG